MKTRYMLFISATLSMLSLQINNVSAASTEESDSQNNNSITTDNRFSVSNNNEMSTTANLNDNKAEVVNNGFQFDDSDEITYKTGVNTNSTSIAEVSHNPMAKSQAITSQDMSNNVDEYGHMLQSWKDIVVGDNYYDKSNQNMMQISNQKDSNVTNLWQTMNKTSQRKGLWNGASELTTSANITTDYKNLESLAIATSNPGSKYYNNSQMIKDVVDGFSWLIENKYNQNIKAYGNWWDWEIGVPQPLNNIVTVMEPYLTKEQIQSSMDAIDFFVSDPNYFRGSVNPSIRIEATGANQVDICKVKIIQALIEKDDVGLKKAVKALEKVFPLVQEGEGFYQDGSFIQHENVGYNGSYGNVLIDGVSQLLPVIQGTPYGLNDNSIDSVKFWIAKGFTPFIHKGNLMDMVRGRAISRGNSQSDVAGAGLIRSIVRTTDIYSSSEKAKYQSLIKYWLSCGDNYETYLKQLKSYRYVALVGNIMEDSSIKANDFQKDYLINFSKMDKVVLKNSNRDFAAAINMSSKRIKRYEYMNNENIHGWYTGDGMFYVYNNDLEQFNDDYWATVDPYKLPGTTETDTVQADGSGTTTSSTKFVGGSVFGNIGAMGNVGSIALDFINNDQDLTAHKSWFLMHDGIVALGSGINNTSKNSAFTTIDNRKLKKDVQYQIYINGRIYKPEINNVQNFKNVTSIYVQSSSPTESMGYKFLTPQNLYLGLVENQGAWSEINIAQSKSEYIRTYLEIYKEHIQDNDSYNYVVYPNMKLSEFTNLTNPTIIKNTSDAQIVKFGNTTGINIFNDSDTKVNDMLFSNPISVTRVDNGNQKLFGVADPSQDNGVRTSFKIKDNGYQILNVDSNLNATLSDGYWNISLKDKGHDGDTHLLSLANK